MAIGSHQNFGTQGRYFFSEGSWACFTERYGGAVGNSLDPQIAFPGLSHNPVFTGSLPQQGRQALSGVKSGLRYVRHSLTVFYCKPLGPDELLITWCANSQFGCVYAMPIYLALSGTCCPLSTLLATDLQTSTSSVHFAILVMCEQNFPMIAFFFFPLTFPWAVLAEANLVTAQNIQIGPSHKDARSQVNQKYFR